MHVNLKLKSHTQNFWNEVTKPMVKLVGQLQFWHEMTEGTPETCVDIVKKQAKRLLNDYRYIWKVSCKEGLKTNKLTLFARILIPSVLWECTTTQSRLKWWQRRYSCLETWSVMYYHIHLRPLVVCHWQQLHLFIHWYERLFLLLTK